jgi:hypothetical protein
MANLSMKVVVGFAIPSPPGRLFHCRSIPPGYARVGVVEVIKDFEGLELEIPGVEWDATLGELMRGSIILWRKKNIAFPNWVPKILTAPRPLIRLFCITILYYNLLLFIDIFHIWR